MNRLVLIADGDSERADRLSEACRAAGVESRIVPHGAAALEAALSDRPGLVVAPTGLKLVDAFKLAEILRANPRTEAARFIFLDDSATQRGPEGLGDVLLPSGARAEEIAFAILDLIEKQDRIEILDAAARSGGEVKGDLAQLPLSDLLQLLHMGGKSGRVVLERGAQRAEDATGSIALRDGDPIQAWAGHVSGEKALFRLLGWREGRFAFVSGRTGEAPSILAPARALLVEAMRQRAEWDRLRAALPTPDAHVRLSVKRADLPNIVHPLTQEVLRLLELYTGVRDLVDHCSFPDYQVLRTLHTLSERGIVQVGSGPAAALPVASEGLFDDAQARRLRGWLQEVAPARPGRSQDARLLVVGSQPPATEDFLRLLRGLGVFAPAPGLTGSIDPEALRPIGRIAVAPGVGIELHHFPLGDRTQALWPIAGHGALGAVFLLQSPVHEAAERVRKMSETLLQMPRARIFHVILLGRGERIAPEDLRDNLSLIDDASVFLLPFESGKDPGVLLRGLFSRVLP